MINTERLCFGCMNDNGGEKVCPVCGFDASDNNPDSYLPIKFSLNNRYLIGKIISVTSESVTYIGLDKSNDSKVEIKEYFPKNFAHRNPDKTVSMVKGGEYTYNEGLMEFAEINTKIMTSEATAVVSVLSVFEENGTVYAISEHIPSITLERFLQKNGGILKWEQARALFLPVIDTVKAMNDACVIHRGISSETIIVGRDGKLRIKDYSIKKTRIADTELDAKIYAGYGAAEQYGFEEMHTDTYTDVYGLCALLFRVLIGNVPPEAAVRLKDDSMTIPARFAEELPRHVLSALANGLQVLPKNRTRNIEELKNELVYAEIAGASVKKTRVQASATVNSGSNSNSSDKNNKKQKKKGGAAKYAIISAVCTVALLIILGVILGFAFRDVLFPNKDEESQSESSSYSEPEVESIGSVESGAEISAKQYTVPELRGKYYSDIADDDQYEMFKIEIIDKAYSDSYAKGEVCAQSLKAGSSAVRDTKIEITISLGSKEIRMGNIKGLDEVNAKLELLKQGFLYNNIEVLEKYDETKKPGVVLEQVPEYNETVNPEDKVKIYINSYKGDEEETSSEEESY